MQFNPTGAVQRIGRFPEKSVRTAMIFALELKHMRQELETPLHSTQSVSADGCKKRIEHTKVYTV